MTRYFLLILISLSIVAGSCSGRKNRAEKNNIIPEKDLVSILTEVHLANGLLTLPKINHVYADLDSLAAYKSIIERHGYNKNQMDKTMRYYFIKRPKKLIRIYDKVLNALSEMEARTQKESSDIRTDQMNLWTESLSCSFPYYAREPKSSVDLPVLAAGTYNLKFTLTIFPDDQSVDPHLGLYFIHTDDKGNEKRDYFTTIPFVKDGQPHSFDIKLIQSYENASRLKGWFIDNENMAAYMFKHIEVKNISLYRTPLKQ